MSEELINKATQYLVNGGLFNPELMDHGKVRDLVYQMRAEIAALKKELTARILDVEIWADKFARVFGEREEARDEVDRLKKELAEYKSKIPEGF